VDDRGNAPPHRSRGPHEAGEVEESSPGAVSEVGGRHTDGQIRATVEDTLRFERKNELPLWSANRSCMLCAPRASVSGASFHIIFKYERTARIATLCFYWRSRPDSNRCTSLERAMSWASRRRERKCRAVARARYYRDPSRLLKLKAFT
jgi:hypothetical protein